MKVRILIFVLLIMQRLVLKPHTLTYHRTERISLVQAGLHMARPTCPATCTRSVGVARWRSVALVHVVGLLLLVPSVRRRLGTCGSPTSWSKHEWHVWCLKLCLHMYR